MEVLVINLKKPVDSVENLENLESHFFCIHNEAGGWGLSLMTFGSSEKFANLKVHVF